MDNIVDSGNIFVDHLYKEIDNFVEFDNDKENCKYNEYEGNNVVVDCNHAVFNNPPIRRISWCCVCRNTSTNFSGLEFRNVPKTKIEMIRKDSMNKTRHTFLRESA